MVTHDVNVGDLVVYVDGDGTLMEVYKVGSRSRIAMCKWTENGEEERDWFHIAALLVVQEAR